MARIRTPERTQEAQGYCVSKATVYALAAPGADTDIVTAFSVGESAGALRVTVCLTTGSVFNLRVTDGSTAYTQAINGGVALLANTLYTFIIPCRAYSTQSGTTALTYSFRVATNSVIQTLFVDEIAGPTL